MSEDNKEINNKNVSPLLIQDEMKDCYLDYAMSVIVGRALPDVRDGLKPVHRRVLYAMQVLNNYHNRPFLKSARVVGDVIGKYHPHGDSAVYGAIVRLAQDFSMRYPIVDGQGNFGSIDGDNAAAMRYTEVRMKKLTEEMLKDIDKDTVDWQPNYDDSVQEPKVLPTRIPNLLINGSSGIAVGMATNIPPHNLSEIVSGMVAIIQNPDITIDQLMEIIPGPDFPTHGIINGTSGIRSAYHTGRGIIQIRAKSEVEVYGKNDRERVIISEIPYQVNKAKLIEKIAYLVNQKTITEISDIRDESSKLGIRIVIDIKKGESGSVLLNKLYKMTQMQVSFGINFLSLHEGQPKLMNIKQQLVYFIDHRKEVVIRRTRYDLKKAKARAHILEGLKIAVENIDRIVEMIKQSAGPEQAKQQLKDNYNLSDIQSQAILDMRLQRLTGLERDKIISDYEAILKLIQELEEILGSEEKIKQIILDEFEEIKNNYGDERRTEIISRLDEIVIEDLIDREEVLVTVTHKGYLKRMAIDTYKSQKRGGKGVKGGSSEDDFYVNLFTANTHDQIFFFTNLGNVYKLKVYEIPEAQRTSKGRNVINLVNLSNGEKIKEIIPIPEKQENMSLIFGMKSGLVKKTSLTEYKNIIQSGIRAVKIQENDEIVNVRLVKEEDDILLCSNTAKMIRFKSEDLRNIGRVSQGVKGIDLAENEQLIGLEVLSKEKYILCVTENGSGKKTQEDEYRIQTRGGKGILAMKINAKTGNISKFQCVDDDNDIMIITNRGQVIRTSINGISALGRATQGVKLINLNSGEKVVSIEKIAEDEESEDGNEVHVEE